ncbi:hypothetical protein ACP70R_000415 [Stipagrostis hirtigluma subsp. patula]
MAPSSCMHADADAGAGAEAETNPEQLYQHFTNLVSSFPSSDGLGHGLRFYRHDQGWNANMAPMVGAMVADACFTARPSDIIVATHPKCGTTWIKALVYATVRRGEHPPVTTADHPVNSSSPHDWVKFLELQLYTGNNIPDLDELPDLRIFATHVPFASLPRSMAPSGSKIVYVCREPKDTLVSMWSFMNRFRVMDGLEPLSMDTAAELFADGLSPYGPYWDHMLGYWDPAAHVRRLAEFVGRPFGAGEEEDGAVDGIVRLCAFEHLSTLAVTKGGKTELAVGTLENSAFFRRGVVGDWVNHLSPEMARRIDAITEAKFKGSGLSAF